MFVLKNADAGPATLKVAWASIEFDCPLKTAGKTDNSNPKPHLLQGDTVVLGAGGNCMARALSGDANFLVDEWCEWERTVLRPCLTNKKALQTNLKHLQEGLQASPTGVHLVGHGDSVADICVCVTLDQHLQNEPNKEEALSSYPVLQAYLQLHTPKLDAAKELQTKLSTTPSENIDLSNPSLDGILNQVFSNAVVSLFGQDVLQTITQKKKGIITKCANTKHGDYQCTAAMPIFGAIKASNSNYKSPQMVAKAIVDLLGTNHPVVTDLSVQGPGFVLLRLQASFLEPHLQTLLQTGQLPRPPKQSSDICVVDFSSPNIAKEMHVGHLRSTIIGEAVCRILEFVGHDVKRVNHVGDWGTQFGMLIQYLKEEYPNFHEEKVNITDLTAFYKNAKQRFDENAEFKKASQINVVRLQSGDEECMSIWKLLCDVSRTEFQKVYDRLDITVDECGESFYNDKIAPVIEEFDKAGHIQIEEGGAKCVFVDKFPIPLMLQKSDGGYGYDSTDMAALKYRLKDIGAKRIIVITDYSQENHFKMVYSAAHKIGWVTDQKLEHIGFGTVQGEDGKRFKTRSGDTVRLVDLLDEAVSRMEGSLLERIKEGSSSIVEEEARGVAEALGYGAVKYFDLRRNPTTNYKFSYDQMLDTKGNTAVYLLYARVRLESIMAKAKAQHNVDVEELLKKGAKVSITHPSERNLALHLQYFADTLEQTLEDLYPYHVCDYVYNLSIAASEFVTQCKVLGSPEMESRLLMCHATTVAMHQCFDLLGIRHIKRI